MKTFPINAETLIGKTSLQVGFEMPQKSVNK
jgi:hypothetical protein